MEKASVLCKAFEKLLDEAYRKYRSTEQRSEAEREAIEEIRSILLEWTRHVTSFEEAKEAYLNTRTIPKIPEATRVAYDKWLSFCTNAREAKEIYLDGDIDNEEKGKAKWLSFFPRAKNLQDRVLRQITGMQEELYWHEKIWNN